MLDKLLSDMGRAITLASNSIRFADKIDRRICMDYRDRLTAFHRALAKDMLHPIEGPYGTKGLWGPNGREPGIRHIIKQVERIAAQYSERKAA